MCVCMGYVYAYIYIGIHCGKLRDHRNRYYIELGIYIHETTYKACP